MKGLTRRHQARELALQVLFQREFVKDIDLHGTLDYFKGVIEPSNEVYQYAEFITFGVCQNQSKLDSKIEAYSQNWALNRIALVDLTIMRIAVFELMFTNNDVPPKTCIDEAVELAKQYSTTDSSAFINGILDQIYKNQ